VNTEPRKPTSNLSHLQRLANAAATAASMPVGRYQTNRAKIHACTGVYTDGRENDRFRDLIDLQLLRDLVEDGGLTSVREACTEIFALRDKHAWPPKVTVYLSWAAGFAIARVVIAKVIPGDPDRAM